MDVLGLLGLLLLLPLLGGGCWRWWGSASTRISAGAPPLCAILYAAPHLAPQALALLPALAEVSRAAGASAALLLPLTEHALRALPRGAPALLLVHAGASLEQGGALALALASSQAPPLPPGLRYAVRACACSGACCASCGSDGGGGGGGGGAHWLHGVLAALGGAALAPAVDTGSGGAEGLEAWAARVLALAGAGRGARSARAPVPPRQPMPAPLPAPMVSASVPALAPAAQPPPSPRAPSHRPPLPRAIQLSISMGRLASGTLALLEVSGCVEEDGARGVPQSPQRPQLLAASPASPESPAIPGQLRPAALEVHID